jgi:hypothetical protein
VVVQSRGTYVWLRRLVTACARVRGREAVLVVRWHTTRWSRLLDAAGSGALAAEGRSHVVVLDRAQASHVEDLGELARGHP